MRRSVLKSLLMRTASWPKLMLTTTTIQTRVITATPAGGRLHSLGPRRCVVEK
jgi:hypothetical protein